MFKVAAVVVLYNPDDSVIDNLSSYNFQVNKLFVVDNSDNFTRENLVKRIQALNNIEYILNHSNLGIAAALNIGAAKAIEEGYDYLLTMDQDSKATEFLVEKLLTYAQNFPDAAIISAYQMNEGFGLTGDEDEIEDVTITMTSGNLISLSKYQNAGGFLEKLFIDYVDHEFCLRLKTFNYRIMRANKVILYHKLGELKRKKILGMDFFPSNHPPERYYYRTRNRFYVNRLYKKEFISYVRSDCKRFIRELIELFFFESKVLLKLKMILKGYLDYRKNIFEKL